MGLDNSGYETFKENVLKMAGEMINIYTKRILEHVDLVTKEYEISRHQTFLNHIEFQKTLLIIFERGCNESLKKGVNLK